MMSIFFFLGLAIILLAEGRTLVGLIASPHLTSREQWVIGFPLGAFINVLLFFGYTIFGIPLSPFAVFCGHLYLVLMFGFLYFHRKKTFFTGNFSFIEKAVRESSNDKLFATRFASARRKPLFWILLISIILKLGYGASQALMYPTYYYDSLSQWNMRARISYEDQAIAFDEDEVRGLSKPQYPILLHSLQIFFMLPHDEWSDTIANAGTLIFTLTSLAAFFLLLCRRNGLFMSTLAFALILAIPLVSHHLVQGLGDIHVLTSLLVSAVLFLRFTDERAMPLLLLSGIFVAMTAWIKIDGLIFGVLPWIILTGVFVLSARPLWKPMALWGALPALIPGGAWSVFLFFNGLPLSPHGGDFRIELHAEAITEVLRVMFASGSFGIHWYALITGAILVGALTQSQWKRGVPELLLCLWGMIVLSGALIIYLATPNVSFLLNAQTFSRTMLLPLSLLVLGVVLLLQKGMAGRGK